MKLHGNAALSLNKRRLLCRRVVEDDWSLSEAAGAAEVSERTAGKWVQRFRAEGEAGFLDRSSAPHSVHNATPEERVQAIAALRRLRFTGAQIAELLAMPEKTVAGILTRIGMGRLGRIGRGAGHRVTGKRRGNPTKTDRAGLRRRQVGWEFVHIAIDDATRLAYAEVLSDEQASTAVGFLQRALAFFGRHGFRVERVMSD